MINLDKKLIKEISEEIKLGKIGVLPTDTIYGIVCSALNKKSIEKLYNIRKRNLKKPMIILIGSIKDLELFKIKADKKLLNKYWPGKTSIIMNCPLKKFEYLHRGKKSIAFRLPDNESLISILKKTGPIVAPSANIEGKDPACTIEEAKKYFEDRVNFYLDVGKLKSKPSKIISLERDKIEIVRK